MPDPLPTDQHVFAHASEVRVRMIVEHLRKAFEQFHEERTLGYADVLMGTHSFHKLITCDLASRLAGEHPENEEAGAGLSEREKNEVAATVYRVARETWDQAMDRLVEKRRLE